MEPLLLLLSLWDDSDKFRFLFYLFAFIFSLPLIIWAATEREFAPYFYFFKKILSEPENGKKPEPENGKKNIIKIIKRCIVGLIGLIFVVYFGYETLDSIPKPIPKLIVWTGLSEHEYAFFNDKIKDRFEKEMADKQQPVKLRMSNVTHECVVPKLLEDPPSGGKCSKEEKEENARVDVITFDINGDRKKLTKYIEDLSDEKGLMPSAVHPTLAKYAKINEKLYFIPFRPNVRLVFWNRKKFKELKDRCVKHYKNYEVLEDEGNYAQEYCSSLTKPPKTWQEVKVAAEQSQETDGEERVVVRASEDVADHFLLEFIRAAGGDACLQKPESLDAVKFLKRLWPSVNDKNNKKSRRYDWRTASGFLGSESVYMGRDWTFSLTVIHAAGKDIGKDKDKVFKVFAGWEWKDAKPTYFLGGELLALPTDRYRQADRKLAIEFIRFLVSRDVQKDIVDALSWPAMRVDAVPPPWSWQHDHLEEINQALLHAEPVPDYWYPDMHKIYAKLFEAIVSSKPGTDDIHSVFLKAQQKLETSVPECNSSNRG